MTFIKLSTAVVGTDMRDRLETESERALTLKCVHFSVFSASRTHKRPSELLYNTYQSTHNYSESETGIAARQHALKYRSFNAKCQNFLGSLPLYLHSV